MDETKHRELVTVEVRHARVRADGPRVVLRLECHRGVRWDFVLRAADAARLEADFPIARHLANRAARSEIENLKSKSENA